MAPQEKAGGSGVERRATRRWAPGVFGISSVVGLTAVVSAGAIFALLLALVAAEWRPLRAADAGVVDAVNSVVAGSGPLVIAAKVITQLGSPLGVGVVVSVAMVWLLIRRLPRLAAYMAVTGLGAAVLGPGVKAFVDRARPLVEVPLSFPAGASFPSGHAVGVTIAWGALLLVFLPVVPARWRRVAVAGAIGVIAIVGLTRVALGVHYLSDVVGGWLLGVLWLAVTASAFRLSREDAGLDSASPLVNADSPEEHRALTPAPLHDKPFPDGAATAARLLVAAVLLTGALIGAGLLITGELAAVRRLDRQVVEWFVSIRTETLTDIAVAVGWLGGVTGSVTVLAIAVPLALAITRRWAPAVFLLVVGAGQGIVYLAASRLVERSRPAVDPVTGDLLTPVSFPSGHVGAAVAIYGAIALLIVAFGQSRWRHSPFAVAVPAAVGVAFSRLYRGAHYPTDVIAGVVYGLIWLALCWAWLRPARRRAARDADGSAPDGSLALGADADAETRSAGSVRSR